MQHINKGTIASINGNTARVMPSDASEKPTAMITIPWHLRGEAGDLKKGTEVVYVEFDDSTGLLLGRADGEWGGGVQGPQGEAGKNAYEYAQEAGYTGTEEEFAEKLSLPAYTYGTEDIEAGSASAEPEGTIHFVYE